MLKEFPCTLKSTSSANEQKALTVRGAEQKGNYIPYTKEFTLNGEGEFVPTKVGKPFLNIFFQGDIPGKVMVRKPSTFLHVGKLSWKERLRLCSFNPDHEWQDMGAMLRTLFHTHGKNFQEVVNEAIILHGWRDYYLPVLKFNAYKGIYYFKTMDWLVDTVICWGYCPEEWDIEDQVVFDYRSDEECDSLRRDELKYHNKY